MESNKEVYVSITGLMLKSPIHFFTFWWHAIRSMAQAKLSRGNIRADAKTINGVHHTLSVWTDEGAMRAFVTSGNHLKAMKAFNRIASGKTFGFKTQTIPDWPEVHRLWNEKGVAYAGGPKD
jgi:hypothetical protein